MKLYLHGSTKAEDIKRDARWPDNFKTNAEQFNHKLILDVLVVAERRVFTKEETKKYMRLTSSTWTPHALMKCGWPLLRCNTLVVVAGEPHVILSMFINGRQDLELQKMLKNASNTATGMFQYSKTLGQLKPHQIVENGPKSGQNHLTYGKMTMVGMYIGLYGDAKGAHHYKRQEAADDDCDFLKSQALHYGGLRAMERLHVPAYADNRIFFAKRVDFPGMIPGIRIETVSSTSASCTTGYACDAHTDSAVRGAAESIYWYAPDGMKLPKGHEWAFAICDACVLFDLNQGVCACYLPGKGVVHGTLPTSKDHYEHEGNGFALVTKARAVGEQAKKHYREFVHRS